MIKNAPTRDKGIATVEMITERADPRDKKITSVTMRSASRSVFMTSRIELST